MKKQMLAAGLFQFVVALVLAVPAVAQQSHYTIHVPFAFHVSSQAFPAGDYRIGIVAPGTVQVRGMDHTVNATLIVPQLNRPANGPESSQLVFHRYGRQYFLSQVWFHDTEAGYQLGISNREREMAQQTPSTEMVLRAAR